MISGYCVECGFPASERCPKCLVKLCGNCLPNHKCKVKLDDTPAKVEPTKPAHTVEQAKDKPEEARAPVLDEMKRKPGRPPVKK